MRRNRHRKDTEVSEKKFLRGLLPTFESESLENIIYFMHFDRIYTWNIHFVIQFNMYTHTFFFGKLYRITIVKMFKKKEVIHSLFVREIQDTHSSFEWYLLVWNLYLTMDGKCFQYQINEKQWTQNT